MDRLDQLGPFIRRRRPLHRTRSALQRRIATLGFLGGSITAPQTGTRWPGPLAALLAERHPGVTWQIANAALGATGSELGVFRVQSEIIARGCDLVFVEYAVNDFDQPPARRRRTREGLLRQLAAAACDVVLVHTFRPEMLADMDAGVVPDSIAEFETLADHYGLTSIWIGLHALREVRRGAMTMAEWLPDGLHPEARGSRSYAQCVADALALEIASVPTSAPWSGELPRPRDAGCWARVVVAPLTAAACHGPWTLGPWERCPGLAQALHTTATGAGLQFDFTGRGLVLGFDFGRESGEVRYRIDGGDWRETSRDCPAWVGRSGWLRTETIAEDLAPGGHRFELETLPAEAGTGRGTATTLGLIGLMP